MHNFQLFQGQAGGQDGLTVKLEREFEFENAASSSAANNNGPPDLTLSRADQNPLAYDLDNYVEKEGQAGSSQPQVKEEVSSDSEPLDVTISSETSDTGQNQ